MKDKKVKDKKWKMNLMLNGDGMAKKQKAWMIWDCTTGSVDGFYFDKKLAKAVLDGLKEAGCVSVMLCEIENKDQGHGIPDHLWHASNGVGFFGRKSGIR